MIIYFDTETTGLHPGEICQLSYIMESDKVTAKNFFFTVDFVEPSAEAVHGFSVERLKVLSGGKRFYDFADEIERDFNSADMVIAHNINFDNSFMREEFSRCLKRYNPKNCFCSMKNATPVCKLMRSSSFGYKYPKLSELCCYCNIDITEINKNTKLIFGGDDEGFHDARFDTTALYLSVRALCEKEQAFIKLKDYL